jgi:hypothetical protein
MPRIGQAENMPSARFRSVAQASNLPAGGHQGGRISKAQESNNSQRYAQAYAGCPASGQTHEDDCHLCTYNRCESLATVLASAAGTLKWVTGSLVVNNNSSDRTGEVVEEFAGYPGRFRYLFGAAKASHMLLTRASKARGDVMAFIDDDVT